MTPIVKNVILAPGASQNVSATFNPAVGSYTVTVNNLSAPLVVAPTPANIILSGLTITPANPVAGQTVTVSVTATNQGGTTGSLDITFNVA